MNEAIKNARTIKLPAQQWESLQAVKKAQEKYLKFPLNKQIDLISKETGIKPKKVKKYLLMSEPFSFQKEYHETTLQDITLSSEKGPVKYLLEHDLKERLSILLESLTEREREIINYRFGLNGEKPLTLKETGKLFGITRERVRQIQEKVMSKFRQKAKYIENYLYD